MISSFIVKFRAARSLGIAATLSCAACGVGLESAGETEDGAESGEAPLQGGTSVTAKKGVVEIKGDGLRTGFILTPNVIVLSAHSLPSASGSLEYSIYYFDPTSGSKRLITDENERLAYRRHPDYVDGASNDIGIIVRERPWIGVDRFDTLDVFADELKKDEQVRIWGRGSDEDGSGSGNLEWIRKPITAIYDGYFITLAGEQGRTCRGDSGGPVIIERRIPIVRPEAYFNFVAGVHSNSQSDEGQSCARVGGKQRHTRVAPRIEWIERAANSALKNVSINCEPTELVGTKIISCK